jgi:hypothetical protein
MSRRAYLLITAIIFSLIALLHLVRIIFGRSATLGSWNVQMWLSWVALIVTGALGYFGFSFAMLRDIERAVATGTREAGRGLRASSGGR